MILSETQIKTFDHLRMLGSTVTPISSNENGEVTAVVRNNDPLKTIRLIKYGIRCRYVGFEIINEARAVELEKSI